MGAVLPPAGWEMLNWWLLAPGVLQLCSSAGWVLRHGWLLPAAPLHAAGGE